MNSDLTRVYAALEGQFNADMLSPDEMEIYEDLLGESFKTPSRNSIEFIKEFNQEGDAVGYDDEGRLVRTLPGGGVEVLEEADGSEW